MPSSSIESCAWVRLTLPVFVAGQTKRPRSIRLENRHSPWPSYQRSLTRSPRLPERRTACQNAGSLRAPVEPEPPDRQSPCAYRSCRKPGKSVSRLYPQRQEVAVGSLAEHGDHPRQASASTAASTVRRTPEGNSISIRPLPSAQGGRSGGVRSTSTSAKAGKGAGLIPVSWPDIA